MEGRKICVMLSLNVSLLQLWYSSFIRDEKDEINPFDKDYEFIIPAVNETE